MKNESNWVVVGRFGRPHGVKGFITIQSFTEPRDNILSYANWHVFIKNLWQPVQTLAIEAHSKNIIALIKGFPERETVTQLTNAEIAVPAEELAQLESGEFYWHQLIGMRVVNDQGGSFGTVVEILATGSNDVLVVEGEKRHLIPYLPGRYIKNVDTSKRLITVDWDWDF